MPSILSHDLHIKSHVAAVALLFELSIVVAFVIVGTQAVESRLAMPWSLALMILAAAGSCSRRPLRRSGSCSWQLSSSVYRPVSAIGGACKR